MMTQLQDAPLVATLESQYRELDEVLSRLEAARVALLSRPVTVWRGPARRAYDLALAAVASTAASACVLLRDARDLTGSAASEVASRG